MSISHFVDGLRHDAQSQGIKVDPLRKARDFVSQLFFERNFDQLRAAENHYKFSEPQLDPKRTAVLIAKESDFAPLADFCVTYFDAYVGHYDYMEMVSTVDQATHRGLIPPPPVVTYAQVEAMIRDAQGDDLELYPIPFTARSLHQGAHQRFVREGRGTWHALYDSFFQDGEALKTVVVDGSVFRYMAPDDEDEDAHGFLCQVYRNGQWSLAEAVHLIANKEDFNATASELHCWF